MEKLAALVLLKLFLSMVMNDVTPLMPLEQKPTLFSNVSSMQSMIPGPEKHLYI